MEKTIENFPGSPKYDAKHWAIDCELQNMYLNKEAAVGWRLPQET